MIEAHLSRITRWLRQVLGGGQQPDRILIRHVTIDDRQTEISAIGLEGLESSEAALASLADDIESTIQADATGLGGIQRYLIVACLGDALIARLPIRQVASELRIGDPVDSEPPNAQGLLSQLMRHNEAQSRLLAVSLGQIVTTMGDTIERQKSEIEKGDAIRVEALQRIEGLISQEHERDMELAREHHRGERRQQVIGFALGMAPVLANRLFGQKLFKEADTSPTKALLGRLFESLTAEQQQKLLGILTPMQLAALHELFASVGGKAESDGAAQPAASPNPDPGPSPVPPEGADRKAEEK